MHSDRIKAGEFLLLMFRKIFILNLIHRRSFLFVFLALSLIVRSNFNRHFLQEL